VPITWNLRRNRITKAIPVLSTFGDDDPEKKNKTLEGYLIM